MPDLSEKTNKTLIDRFCFRVSENPSLIRHVSESLFGPDISISEVQSGGLGYESRKNIEKQGELVMVVFYGGANQNGTMYFDITGKGASFVAWGSDIVLSYLDELPGILLRRIDLAADFFQGEINHDQIKQAYLDGQFINYRRSPKTKTVGSINDPDAGRTIYIGKRGQQLFLRCYEKGKKEFNPKNNPLPDWYRVELEFRPDKKSKFSVSHIVKNRDGFFTGAYPFLAQILPSASPIKVPARQSPEHELKTILGHVRRQYGPTLKTAIDIVGLDNVIDSIVSDYDNLKLKKIYQNRQFLPDEIDF